MILLGIIFAILGSICLVLSIKRGEGPLGLISGILLTIAGLFGSWIINKHNAPPTAIDVYRNKTTLEIKYRDGIPVDSLVIFKDYDNTRNGR